MCNSVLSGQQSNTTGCERVRLQTTGLILVSVLSEQPSLEQSDLDVACAERTSHFILKRAPE